MARNKAEIAAGKVMGKIKPVIEDISGEAQIWIKKGLSPADAVKKAVVKTGFEDKLTRSILNSVGGIVDTSDAPGLRRWWLNKVWRGEKMTLSAKINDVARMGDIVENISTSMRHGKSWTAMARSLTSSNLTHENIPKYIRELENAGRRLMAGDVTAVQEYRRAVTRAMKNVDRLAQAGAPTERLKKAYQAVVDATEKQSEKALDKAIDRTIRANANYNAERIARTESARAYSQQTYSDVLDDEQVVAIGYDLNDEHPKVDICDFHTGVDLFKLGAGRYPLTDLPPYPFHPQCLCSMYNVYSGEAGKMDTRAGGAFLRDMDADERRAMLGVAGEKEFRRDASSWKDNLKNYNGHEDIKNLMEVTRR